MKVVILAAFVGMKDVAGGVEQHVKNLILHLPPAHVTLVSLEDGSSEGVNEDLPAGVSVVQVRRLPLPMTISGPILEAFRLAHTVKRLNPDVVHVHMLGAPHGVAALLLARRYPVVLTAHSTSTQRRKFMRGIAAAVHDAVWGALERVELARIRYVVAVSLDLAHALRRLGAPVVHVIPNGVGDEWFEVESREIDGRILFVGRLAPQKGLEVLLEAARTLRERGQSFELHIIGPPVNRSYVRRLRELASSYNLSSVLTMPLRSFTDQEVRQEYEECAVFVLPSIVEPQGIVLLQAMAASKAIVASHVGGISEMLAHGEEAVLVPPRDSVALAAALERLLTDKKSRLALGQRARERASKYRWGELAPETFAIYKEAIRNGVERG